MSSSSGLPVFTTVIKLSAFADAFDKQSAKQFWVGMWARSWILSEQVSCRNMEIKWLSSAAMPECSSIFPILHHCCLCNWHFKCLRHRNELVNKTAMSHRIPPFCSDVIWWEMCPAHSNLGLVLSSASTTQANRVLRFSILRWVPQLLFIGILQGIVAGIGTSNFLNSSSFGSIKNIPLNCLALSNFGFSISTQTMCTHQVAFRSIRWILWSLSMHPIVLFSPSTFQWSSTCFSIITSRDVSRSGNVDVLRWNKKCFFFRHVQIDSWHNVMAINEFSCDHPEVIFRFHIITGWVFFNIGWSAPLIWITLKNFWFFVSFRSVPDQGGCSQTLSPTKFLTVPSATGKMKFPLLLAATLPLHWVFWRRVQIRPSAPILQGLRP